MHKSRKPAEYAQSRVSSSICISISSSGLGSFIQIFMPCHASCFMLHASCFMPCTTHGNGKGTPGSKKLVIPHTHAVNLLVTPCGPYFAVTHVLWKFQEGSLSQISEVVIPLAFARMVSPVAQVLCWVRLIFALSNAQSHAFRYLRDAFAWASPVLAHTVDAGTSEAEHAFLLANFMSLCI